MNRITLLSIAVIALGSSARAVAAPSDTIELTGWFSEDRCATARVKSGAIGPTGRDCAQKCLAAGAKLVFIDEQGKRLLQVANPKSAIGQESHYVRVTGALDGETLSVESVQVVEEYVASCRRPRRK
jgi:hypothetical protein